MMPRRQHDTHRAEPLGIGGQRADVFVLVPRAENDVKAAVKEDLRRNILLILIMIFPIRDDDAAVKQVKCGGGIVIVSVCHGLEGRIGKVVDGQKLVVPDDRTASVRADVLGQLVDVFGKQLMRHARAALSAGRKRICLIKAEMEIAAVAAQVVKLRPHLRQQLFRIGIRQTPRPAVRLKQECMPQIGVEKRMPSVRHAGARRMPEMVDHRNDLHAVAVRKRYQRRNFRAGKAM